MYQPTITQQYAIERIKQLVQGTAGSISPRPRLEHYDLGSDIGQCVEGQNDPRSQVSSIYYLRDVRKANASIGEQILRLWKKRGYGVGDISGMGTSEPEIHAITPDDFMMSLEITGSGDLSVGVSSPCLWPDGTPPPHHMNPPGYIDPSQP